MQVVVVVIVVVVIIIVVVVVITCTQDCVQSKYTVLLASLFQSGGQEMGSRGGA